MPTQPMQPTAREHALLANKLEFLRTHRGRVRGERDAVLVESSRPQFTFAIPGARPPSPELFERFHTFIVAPWAGPASEPLLIERGYAHKSGMSVMTLPEGKLPPAWDARPSGLEVRLVRTEDELEAFSETQARSFCEKQEVYDEWHPWLREANFRNLRNQNQAFYVGYLDAAPVGAALMVFTERHAGLYAVATLPAQRKRGVSTAIMARAIADAGKERGFPQSTVTLQTIKGSYAESFYEKLGFETAFELKTFVRAP